MSRKLLQLHAGLASLACAVIASAALAAGAEPDISGIWWAATYSPKLLPVGGGDPPLNAAGKTRYQENMAGLRSGTLVDKARKICIPDGVPRVLETPIRLSCFRSPEAKLR